jgi:hypothetical protein
VYSKSILFFDSGARLPWGLQSEPDLEVRTQIFLRRAPALQNMRKGEPNTSLGLASGISIEDLLAARICHTLSVPPAWLTPASTTLLIRAEEHTPAIWRTCVVTL